MKLLGFEITKAVPSIPPLTYAPTTRGRGWTTIFESFPGAWQRNIELTRRDITAHAAVFA